MNRAIMTVMAIIGLTTAAGTASAARARFCATWAVPQFEDGDFGEDYLDLARTSPPTTYNLVAKRTSAEVKRNGSVIWFGQLDPIGCTPYLTATNGQYIFTRHSRLEYGGRVVRIMLDDYAWEDWTSQSLLHVATTWNLYNVSGDVTVTAPATATTYQGKLMPVFAQLLERSETYDLLENEAVIWVSTDPDPLPPHDEPGKSGCGTKMWSSDTPDSDYFHICISRIKTSWKFHIGHEYGHAVSIYKDGPSDGNRQGSEGCLRASGDDGRCNCDNVPESSNGHCLHSREFTGQSQKEGFSHFVSTLGYNARSTAGGKFVYYKDVREPLFTHYSAMPSFLPNPLSDTDNEEPPPYDLIVDNSANVNWMEWECDPTGEWLEHYGVEWDWISFFWNLWADTADYEFSANEMMNVWDNVPDADIAYLCCVLDGNDDPLICLPRDMSAECGESLNIWPTELEIGKLWDTDYDYDVTYGLVDKALTLYGSNMRDNFFDKGDEAGVNH